MAVLVAAVVAVLLATRGAERPAASAPSAPAATPTTTAELIDGLATLRRIVDEGAAAGEVRADVALDFGNLISDLQNKVAAGEPVDRAARIAQLRVKVDQRLREGGLSAKRAGDLRAALAGLG